ncbi:oxidoreductase [Pseudomonas sp. GD03858]|uniref:oxidoreductase n=1 Tax=unclassified Pseudomonas TaxID=196821 RepID=UPI00244D4C62|nr:MULTISPECIES: oxidoreductase [unclassified Pseudomonas]MDH0649319.1 oxidoreductase [Pseudomonas sp. GD03867]MDH0665702.1 oxidoreductase [Pseudomonas sp. GD03858]
MPAELVPFRQNQSCLIDEQEANLIPVSIWVEGTADALQERLFSETQAGVDGLGHAAQAGLVDISVAVGTLDANARKLLQGVRVSSAQAAQLVRTSFTGLRGVAGSWELLLALGGLYLMNDSLEKNLQRAEAEIGAKSTEALLALHGARMALLGGGIEALGLIIRASSSQIAAHVPMGGTGAARVQNSIGMGRAVMRIGAVLGAVAGIYDIGQSGLAIKRNFAAREDTAVLAHLAAGVLYGFAGFYSIAAVFTPLIFGPLGLAIVLGMAAYGATKFATAQESTPLELWTKRCYFGLGNETPSIHWNTPEYSDIAFAELNAATLGMVAELKFEAQKMDHTTRAKTGNPAILITNERIKYRILLPNFDRTISAYAWNLKISSSHKHTADNTSKTIASGEYQTPSHFEKSITTAKNIESDQTPKVTETYTTHQEISKLEFTSTMKQEYFIEEIAGFITPTKHTNVYSLKSLTLTVSYWPDRGIPDAFAEVTIERKAQ